jgi:hypothetical protein
MIEENNSKKEDIQYAEKELVIREDLNPIISKIDNIISECLPITAAQCRSIRDALVLAKGISELRKLFIGNSAIRSTIESMQDTKLGFMTDRSPASIKKSNLRAYTYEEVTECVIDGLLRGYRITNNEMNIIAGNFYPAKNGKFRKIQESEGLTDLTFGNTPPIYKTESRISNGKKEDMQYAEIECRASWKINGQGFNLGDENDPLKFKIKVNAYMGDDGVVGKALSKLFTRVLMRLTGKILDEATDIDNPSAAVAVSKENKSNELENKIKSVESFDPVAWLQETGNAGEFEICAYCQIENLTELTPAHIENLRVIVNSIRSGRLAKEEFWNIAANRMKEKNEGILIGSEK